MSMRFKLTASVIAVMGQCFVSPYLDGPMLAINSICLALNCWFLGGYIKEVTK